MLKVFQITFFCILLSCTFCHVTIDDKMKSFAHSKKQNKCEPGIEHLLYEHTSGPGVITEQTFAGQHCFNKDTILRYYIDGDIDPTIEGNIYMIHGIGKFDNIEYQRKEPWDARWIGNIANGGGFYNTIRIPFQKSIRVAFVSNMRGYWWYVVHGLENFPVIIGDIKLPPTAKLVLQVIEKVFYPPFAYVKLGHSKRNGLLFMVSLAASSPAFQYLEGCFRMLEGKNTSVQYLSSGTEDFFLSAYYYQGKTFQTQHSGLTLYKEPGTMSAYKFFIADPILFHGVNLIWRVGEARGSDCFDGKTEKCFSDGDTTCKPGLNETNSHDSSGVMTEVSSYVWFYEW